MSNKQTNFHYILAIAFFLLTSCSKNWLDEKPDSKLAVATTLNDFQALNDGPLLYVTNALGEIGGDNYYISDLSFQYLYNFDIAEYIWAPNGYGVSSESDWEILYKNIFSSNTVLDGLSNVDVSSGSATQYDQVKGTALYFRGYDYYELAQTFCKSYDSATAQSDPGIPLMLHADVNERPGRGTVAQLYGQLFSDLLQAAALLPNADQLYKTRPNKAAAFAMLARAYLSIGSYRLAELYADSALAIKNVLLDYNTLSANGFQSMPGFNDNPEVIAYSTIFAGDDLSPYGSLIDSTLYNLYDSSDLRQTMFFTDAMNYIGIPGQVFYGTYNGSNNGNFFTAPAVDELYLIRAECEARNGQVTASRNDLNFLLQYRYVTGKFTPVNLSNTDSLLAKILLERRKELVMRATRWTDLRRLNKDNRFATTLTRNANGTVYTLSPNSNLYVYPIPDDEITVSNIAQNPR
ncbi:RagB/SusD family nutrient uptake outer membrane protein [Dinghuibacter silviterrae]|uniref:SusD-like starch-binding protein associating with outer membrane n=1 Tax=Dinghuibacter silviterrae TaxID=1539049 RepID=A0A4R8DHY6_9BACT|nr:RagB/SusD family nutrient uptake outer membrane protein [Dinghuibacter silviterrae]TDW97088.1 SusD-like starch-binding protein associating with outer membrane [Dinghuibacter silviterrae]